jgi:hypothetical protein
MEQVAGGGDVSWSPLDFMNLPGSVDRRPLFTSPYHYRLDWETWIRTTASFEVSVRTESLADAIVSGGGLQLCEISSEKFAVLQYCGDCSCACAYFQGRNGPLHVPEFITELAQQIMLGDTDAM